MPSNYDLVREAILQRKIVSATYDGYHRLMCPHVIGTKNGRRQALFYQFGGESRSGLDYPGSPKNWRCIPVDVLTDVLLVDGDWHTAPNHSRPQTCVGIIDVEVEF